jgi:predicted ATP-dependent protease
MMKPLPADSLVTRCDPAQFTFATTEDLPEDHADLGHTRAVDAVQLALAIGGRGYNVFVLGTPGSGRHTLVQRLLQAHAATLPAPPDWCYVNNFTDANRPHALRLPPGEGSRLRAAMQRFVSELGKTLASAFEGDEYRSRLEAIQQDTKQREEESLQALGRSAAEQGVIVLRTPQGFAFAPSKEGEPMPSEEFDKLSEAERERLEKAIHGLRERLTQMLHELPRLRREMQGRIREATRETMSLAAGQLIDELKEAFATLPNVLDFLEQVRHDVIESGEQFRTTSSGDDEEVGALTGSLSLQRYQVNLLVEHAVDGHAPVLTAHHPTYAHLVGRVDHLAHMGTLLTNFTLIKSGALHEANGGYLMLDAEKVLTQPLAWDSLKRALKSGEIRIESLPQALGLGAAGLPLEPEPIPLQVKVVLFGERIHYELLQALDAEFEALFKIAADFEDEVRRDTDHTERFARLVGSMARTQGLRPLEPAAVARMAEHASRLAGDAAKLSTRTRPLSDLLHEADAQAARAGRAAIAREDIVQALAAREHRADRSRDVVRDALLRDTLMISTAGEHIGQVNALVVTESADFRFAFPVRVTATARLGEGDLVDIEHESTLGGPIHSKGVMILAAFLGARYARDLPLSLAASVVFEQSYGPIEGDSASLAELCALMSVLAFVPVRQTLAVTGSVNQFGQVQPVGAVNEKVEGFFDLCVARGLSGDQGVLIPRANVKDLMLRDEVVQAAAEGHFHIYAVDDIDQTIELLTGLPAGMPNAKGEVPEGSINYLVAAKLLQLSLARQAFAAGPAGPMARERRRKPAARPRAGRR